MNNLNTTIIKITNVRHQDNDTIITGQIIKDEKLSKEEIVLNYESNIPVKVNDILTCMYKTYDNVKFIHLMPTVKIPTDEYSVSKFFMNILNVEYRAAKAIYKKLERNLKSMGNLINVLDELSERYCKERDDNVLIYIKGILTDKSAKKIFNSWYEEYMMRKLYLLGIEKNQYIDTFMDYKTFTHVLNTNPLRIETIDYKISMYMIKKNELKVTDLDIECNIVKSEIKKLMDRNKTTYVNKIDIINRFDKFDDKKIKYLVDNFGVVEHDNYLQLDYAYKFEKTVADLIIKLRINNIEKSNLPFNKSITSETGDVFFRKEALQFNEKLSDDQKNAIQGVLDNDISMITGGPGTGKSTIIYEIVLNLMARKEDFRLCSFTGNAVSRIDEIANSEKYSSTFDRMIFNPSNFKKNGKQTFDILIVDESSMTSTELFYRFIKTFDDIKKIILVGDVNQLPPISFGSFFHELMKSKRIPVYKLTTSHRFKKESGDVSGIMHNCNKILEHTMGEFMFDFVNNGTVFDDFFVKEGGFNEIKETILYHIKNGTDYKNILIVSPYKSPLNLLNKMCQDIYHEKKEKFKDMYGRYWCLGDLVMFNVNDNLSKVYNGSKGIVTYIDKEKMSVQFKFSSLNFLLLKNSDESSDTKSIISIDHFYAVTVDKSQGIEYDIVIYYVEKTNKRNQHFFVCKNRTYVAISRAKKYCYIIGDIDCVRKGININAIKKRKEMLSEFLSKELNEIESLVNIEKSNKEVEYEKFCEEMADEWGFGFD